MRRCSAGGDTDGARVAVGRLHVPQRATGRLRIRRGARYVGESYADQANTLAVPARGLFDTALHYEYQQWRAALNVTNVADKTFVSSCDGVTSCFYGERRKAMLSLGYRW
jgi:iron complex outermembrane receptor protein